MKLVLVPEWVSRVIGQESLLPGDVVNPEMLLSTLSKDDVAFYVWLNTNLERWLPATLDETFNTGCGSALPFNEAQLGELHDGLLSMRMEYDNGKTPPHPAELFGLLTKDVPTHVVRFVPQVVNHDTVLLHPKHDATLPPIDMENTLLRLLHGRYPFETVAATPLFKHFVSMV